MTKKALTTFLLLLIVHLASASTDNTASLLSFLPAYYPKSYEEFASLLEKKESAIQAELKKQLEHLEHNPAFMEEVSRQFIGRREVSRRVISESIIGNQRHITYEVEYEDTYEIMKKLKEKEKEKLIEEFAKQYQAYFEELREQFLSYLLYKAIDEELQALKPFEETVEPDPWDSIKGIGIDIVQSFNPMRVYEAYQRGDYAEAAWEGGMWTLTFFPLIRGSKIIFQTATAALKKIPISDNFIRGLTKHFVDDAAKKTELNAIRSVEMAPRNLYEQIAEKALASAKSQEIRVIQEGRAIRDLARLESQYGKREWQKCHWTLKNKEGKDRAILHFYRDKLTNEIFDLKFKNK